MKTNEQTNQTTKEKRKVFNYIPLIEFLEESIYPNELAEYLETIIFEYSILLLKSAINGECITHHESIAEVNYLNQLKEVLKNCEAIAK